MTSLIINNVMKNVIKYEYAILCSIITMYYIHNTNSNKILNVITTYIYIFIFNNKLTY